MVTIAQNSKHSCLTKNIMVRFPDIAIKIFDQLGNDDLVNCRKLNESFRNFLDNQKIPWIRMIQKYGSSTSGFLQDWKQVTGKTPTRIVKEIAIQTELFFKSNSERQNGNWSPHFIVADQGDLELYKYIGEKTGCINPKKSDGNRLELHKFVNARIENENFEEIPSPFEMAIIKGQMEICKFIMANKDNGNAKTENGVTHLHLAARYGNFELCKLLLENMSDKSPQTIEGWQPLHEAASFGHLKICSLLMSNVPDINPGSIGNGVIQRWSWITDPGTTVLHLAALFNQIDVCKLLINNEVDVNVQTVTGKTALHEAARVGALEVCQFLMENMENKMPLDNSSMTPFHIAAQMGQVKTCKLFMDQNLSYKKPLDIFRRSPLATAVAWGHLNVSKLLIDKKEDENIVNKCVRCRLLPPTPLQCIELKSSLGNLIRSRRYASTFLHLFASLQIVFSPFI